MISKSLFHYINLLLENRFSACGKDLKEKAYYYQVLNIMPKHCLETMCVVYYIIIRVHSAFSLVASCVLLKYTRTDDVN